MIRQFTGAMRLAVFASGGGSNFQAILNAIDRGALRAEAVLCLSNRPDAGALERARAANVPQFILPPQDVGTAMQGSDMLDALEASGANFIALAGYLKMIPSEVVRAFHGRIINIHPALLPAFGGSGMYGRRVHQAALECGVRWTGVTVHFVDEAYDTGPIVLQEPVPVSQDDTIDTLAARVLEAEHRIYPEALRLFAEGRVVLDGRSVRILDLQHAS